MAGKDLLEPVVIADAGQHGAIRGQCHRPQWTTIGLESSDQLAGQVLRVGRAPSVSAPEDGPIGGEAPRNSVGESADRLSLSREQADDDLLVLGQR